MKKIFIVLLFILLGSALIVVNNSNKNVKNSFTIVYENNKNLALPDLTNKTEITKGLFRLYDDNGFTADYNIYNGIIAFNGTLTTVIEFYLTSQFDMVMPPSITGYYYLSGSTTANEIAIYSTPYNPQNVLTLRPYTYMNNNFKVLPIELNRIRFQLLTGDYNNLQFRLQIEEGSIATTYVVPKLIPMYQDNLSMEEKQEIGLGAFGGITKIIKTINDIIKPVGDFINGLLSWF